jgi:transposase
MKKKKVYTAEEKAIILREHLDNSVPVSELAEKYDIHPNVLYHWKKQLFEAAPKTLVRKTGKDIKRQSADRRKIEELEALLKKRESLITELVQENIELKKNSSGMFYEKNGLNRR